MYRVPKSAHSIIYIQQARSRLEKSARTSTNSTLPWFSPCGTEVQIFHYLLVHTRLTLINHDLLPQWHNVFHPSTTRTKTLTKALFSKPSFTNAPASCLEARSNDPAPRLRRARATEIGSYTSSGIKVNIVSSISAQSLSGIRRQNSSTPPLFHSHSLRSSVSSEHTQRSAQLIGLF